MEDSPCYDFWLSSVKSMLDLFGVVSIVPESLGCVMFNLNTLLVADYTNHVYLGGQHGMPLAGWWCEFAFRQRFV
jgi:hypothetical protein